jgi:hypothetical protein
MMMMQDDGPDNAYTFHKLEIFPYFETLDMGNFEIKTHLH